MNEVRNSSRHASGESTKSVLYCVVPARLALELHDALRDHYGDLDDLEVIVERRHRDRRADGDRRGGDVGPPPGGERRRIRNSTGRRIADRRVAQTVAHVPDLPPWAAQHRASITFVERFEPSSLALEDVDTARLVTRIQGGDDNDFARLYSRYFERVYSYERAVLRDAYEAEDATQQTFMKALEALHAYERRTDPFRSWLFAIARNCGTDFLRKGGRVHLLGDAELDRRREGAAPPAGEPLVEWLSDRNLARDFRRLPDPQQQVLVMRFLLDLSVRETARALERSEDNVKTLQSRALGSMRRRLGGAGASSLAAI